MVFQLQPVARASRYAHGYFPKIAAPILADSRGLHSVGFGRSRWVEGAFNLLVSSAEGGAYGRWQRSIESAGAWHCRLSWVASSDGRFYQHSRIVDGGTNGCKGTLACSSSFTAPVFDFIVNKYFCDLASSRAKLTLSYRVELSDVATGHFVVVSLASESNLYFSGF